MQHIYLSILGAMMLQNLSAQETPPVLTAPLDNNNPITIEGSYTGDVFSNLRGGIKTGSGYLGMASMSIGFDTEKAGWWKGGQLHLHGATTHGDTPTASYLGDLQTASNIEAGDHIYIQEMWFGQTIGNTQWMVGVQDLNAEFVSSETGGLFLNSSFGIPSLLSYNVPVPIFPLTSLGITGKWQISDALIWKGAIFDGNPTPWEKNAYNLGWNIKKDDGLLMITEVELATSIMDHAGTYKLGSFYHTGLNETDEQTQITTTVFDYDYGFYFLGDQQVWSSTNNRELTLFAQASVCPENINTHHYYIGGGMQLTGLFNKAGEDALGLAVAHAGFKNQEVKHETTIELSYQMPITDNLYVQPDVQYIIQPAGTEEKLNNALALFVRIGVSF